MDIALWVIYVLKSDGDVLQSHDFMTFVLYGCLPVAFFSKSICKLCTMFSGYWKEKFKKTPAWPNSLHVLVKVYTQQYFPPPWRTSFPCKMKTRNWFFFTFVTLTFNLQTQLKFDKGKHVYYFWQYTREAMPKDGCCEHGDFFFRGPQKNMFLKSIITCWQFYITNIDNDCSHISRLQMFWVLLSYI